MGVYVLLEIYVYNICIYVKMFESGFFMGWKNNYLFKYFLFRKKFVVVFFKIMLILFLFLLKVNIICIRYCLLYFFFVVIIFIIFI